MLKTFFSKFLLPSIVNSAKNLLDINYNEKAKQKSDSDLVIANSTSKIVATLKPEEKEVFFSTIRFYFSTVCGYMKCKFPFECDILLSADVPDINSIVDASFAR
ncbi:hypothetical protein AVEN_247399-1 [Araneus ventricosus]|uniref:Uncharacterized protein n=1 Tax=Araneus ventricosus TaxID=182803 RepID=A0A4Y2M4Y4_ARAVE|nr:hypothetical protein AVEN_247399-1 [Araneus ventricosus]